LIEHIPELVGAGVNSFKIEGRMKSANYVAGVVKTYRMALDAYKKNPHSYRFDPAWLEEISKVSHRNYTTGFLFGSPGASGQHYGAGIYQRSHIFVGLVRDYDLNTGQALVEQRNRFEVGAQLEVLVPDDSNFIQKVNEIIDDEGRLVEAAPHPRQMVRIPFDRPVSPYTILRKIV
jgi:putative protease